MARRGKNSASVVL